MGSGSNSNMGRWFSTPTISSTPDTSRVSYNSTQFWHYLPGESIRFHRLTAQFHKTALSCNFRHQSQAPVVSCVSNPPATDWMFPWPPPWFSQLARAVQRTQRSILLITLLVYYKKIYINQEQPYGRDIQDKVRGKGEELPCLLQVHHSPQISTCLPTQKLSEPCSFGFFYGGFITVTID